MDHQPLLNLEPLDHTRSRSSDPATSRAAESGLAKKLTGVKRQVMAVADQTPRTARELAELAFAEQANASGTEVETFRKRVRELCRDGLLVECPSRNCRHTGKSATTYTTAEVRKPGTGTGHGLPTF